MRYQTVFFRKDTGDIILVRKNTYVRSKFHLQELIGSPDIKNISFIYFTEDIPIDTEKHKVQLPTRQAPAQIISKDNINISLQLIQTKAQKIIQNHPNIIINMEGGTGDYVMQADVIAALTEKYTDKRFIILAEPSRHTLLDLFLPASRISLKPNATPPKNAPNLIDFSRISRLDYYSPPFGKVATYALLAGLDPEVTPRKPRISKTLIKKTLKKLSLPIDPKTAKIIALHLVSGNNNAKSYPYTQQLELATALSKDNDLIFLQIGGYGEKPIDHPNVINCLGRFSWDEVVALVSISSAAICIDSAIMHIACHLEKPTISLWGPIRPEHILPRSYHTEILAGDCHNLFCGRFECANNRCMASISPTTIVDTLKKLWHAA